MMLEEMGKNAKAASSLLAASGCALKNAALLNIAEDLVSKAGLILAENEKDIAAAKAAGMTEALIDRLTLTALRIGGIANGIISIISLDDPVGKIDGGWLRPNGLRIIKTRVPLGVIGIIFESRPNVTADAASLCLKSGNACILRGGKEAINSNIAIAAVMREAIKRSGLPEDCVQLVGDTSREVARELMRLNKYIDVLIPRGGAGLIKTVIENSTVPVIETGTGNCHIYIDAYADLEMGAKIIFNAKTSRPSVCNAAETLLVHRDVAELFLPMAKKMLDTKNVELRADEATRRILGSELKAATQADWETEYNDYILAVRVVDSLDAAIEHINRYGTRHSEAIVTGSYESGEKFMRCVDAAAVYINASTRFTDGNEFGFGAEIGISNQKLHARGPMGLHELTTVKYQIYGSGQIR